MKIELEFVAVYVPTNYSNTGIKDKFMQELKTVRISISYSTEITILMIWMAEKEEIQHPNDRRM